MRRSPTTPKKQATKATITQQLLGEYYELCSHEKQVKTRQKQLRAELIQLHQQSASVQPGRFQLRVSKLKQVYLSWPRVSEVLDEDMCDLLREKIPPTVFMRVSVFLADKSKEDSNETY